MAETKKVPGLRVAAKTKNFRRAGRAWSEQVTDVPLSDFTKGQVEQLKADPGLVVVDIEIEVDDGIAVEAAATAAGKKK
ncbi:hypothetical protein DLREEDagrD3_28940 [Denitratisoma sp. agr-D3]